MNEEREKLISSQSFECESLVTQLVLLRDIVESPGQGVGGDMQS